MVEEFRYEDKRVGIDENDKWSLKNLVNEEFKKIDRYWYRDDQEIRNAWWNIINKLITEIKQDKNMVYGSWALNPLIQLSKKLKEEYNNMNWRKLITNNEDKINQVAQRIDNAENETLKRLAKNRTTQDSRDIVRRSNEVYKKNPMFVMEWWNDSSKQTWNIIFTKESNPVKIHEALNWLFKDPNVVYEIDYSGCTNQRIKDKMVWLIWTETCYLKYDKGQNTYTIRDSQWNWISHRAYIWEWVKLIPAWVRQRQAYREQKTQNENLWKVDNSQIDFLIGGMLKDMPSARRLTEEEQKDLVKKTEDRITELLIRAKKLWYELETECVTKKWLWKWHVELHLNSGSSEVDWTVWWNGGSYNGILWEKLDNFIDSNEWEYVKYLTKRVMSKWQELDSLTKIETTNVDKEWGQDLTEEEKEQAKLHKEQVLYWISLFEKMVDNYKESEWDSWDNDDRDLEAIKKLINNAKASIENSRNINDNIITEKFIDPIREKWASFKNISKTYNPQYNELQNVFFWIKTEQILGIRNLWWYNRIFDKTETSFLREEIELNEDLTVKDENIKECIDNINSQFSMSVFDEDGNINEETKEQYDKLFVAASGWISSLISLLVDNKMLPITWRKEEDYVIEWVEKLKNQLKAINEQLNNFPYTPQSMAEHQHAEKLRLQQKENKTEDDIMRLQVLTYLENNPEEQKMINEEIINQMKIELKYWNLWNIIKWCLFRALAELWWWAEWKNADIYSDIIWYGAFDFSDENAKIVGDFVWDILEEVAILAVAIAIGTVTAWAGTALIMWARATRLWAKGVKYGKYIYELANKVTKPIWKIIKRTGNFVKTSKTWQKIAKATESMKYTKLWKNLNKIRLEQNTAKLTASQGNRVEILRLWRKENKTLWDMYKLWSLTNKEWRMWTKMLAAIFEWTWFHLSSTAIHNAINWVDLSTWLNPFGYTEWPNWEKISNFMWYVQSIAFLWILKTVGQPIQNLTQASLTSLLWEKISANVFWKILQQIGSITWEFWSLTVTDETINVIFEWNLKELTVEDAIHSLGMILWLRAYWKIKQIANLKIKGYNRNKKELNAEIDGNDNVVTEDMLDRQEQRWQKDQIETKDKIPDFNNENWKFELDYIEKINYWTLKINENWISIWEVKFSVKENCIYIDGLISSKKGSWTQLMQKLVEISESLWKWWHIELTASPYIDAGGWQKSYRKWKTNLWFYYKLWFEAKNPEIHKQIQEYIDKWEEIPLKLNIMTEVYLTEKWIKDLKNNKKSHGLYERREREEQQRREREKMERNEINDTDSLEVIAKKLEESLNNNTDFEVSKEAFTSWRFIEWIKNRFTKMIKIPNHSIPKDSIKRLRNKISEMMKKWGNSLSENWKKAIERFNRFLDNLLKQPWESVRINRQRPSDRPERWINTERREMSEVERNSDVIAIWDLHWEYIALKWNMEYAWLAREVDWHLEWTGWNKKVVFQWDILADRWTDWLRIVKEIHQLREQALKQWWDIDIIVWNHDDFMIAYLLWWKVSRFAMNGEASALDIAMNGSQWKWLTELLDFIQIKRTWEFDDFFNLSRKNNEILNAMRNSTEWRMILEEICNMKLVSQVDDVLYCHTNPTSRMLQYLTRWNIQTNINTLNQKYQWFLKKALLWEWNWNISLDEFNNISNIFLNTWNRDISWIENYVEQLRNSGINMISHGHSGWWGKMNGKKIYNNNSVNIKWLRIVDTDYSYWKWWNTNRNYSISVIKKDYWKQWWGSEVYEKPQAQEYQLWQEVYVKRSAWWESKARVESYDPKTGEYIVRWNEWWQILEKRVTAESLRIIA